MKAAVDKVVKGQKKAAGVVEEFRIKRTMLSDTHKNTRLLVIRKV